MSVSASLGGKYGSLSGTMISTGARTVSRAPYGRQRREEPDSALWKVFAQLAEARAIGVPQQRDDCSGLGLETVEIDASEALDGVAVLARDLAHF